MLRSTNILVNNNMKISSLVKFVIEIRSSLLMQDLQSSEAPQACFWGAK